MLNVEMTLDEGPDEANLMQDAYDVLKQYPPGAIPPQVLVELSPLSSKMKQRVLQLTQQPVDPAAVQAKALALKEKAAEIGEKEARAERHRSQTVSDAARAAQLMSGAHLDSAQAIRRRWKPRAGRRRARNPRSIPASRRASRSRCQSCRPVRRRWGRSCRLRSERGCKTDRVIPGRQRRQVYAACVHLAA
jgi:hypothetical protein